MAASDFPHQVFVRVWRLFSRDASLMPGKPSCLCLVQVASFSLKFFFFLCFWLGLVTLSDSVLDCFYLQLPPSFCMLIVTNFPPWWARIGLCRWVACSRHVPCGGSCLFLPLAPARSLSLCPLVFFGVQAVHQAVASLCLCLYFQVLCFWLPRGSVFLLS